MAQKKPSTDEKLQVVLEALAFVLNHLFISHRGEDLTTHIDKVKAVKGDDEQPETRAD